MRCDINRKPITTLLDEPGPRYDFCGRPCGAYHPHGSLPFAGPLSGLPAEALIPTEPDPNPLATDPMAADPLAQ